MKRKGNFYSLLNHRGVYAMSNHQVLPPERVFSQFLITFIRRVVGDRILSDEVNSGHS